MTIAQKTIDDVFGKVSPPAGTIGAGESPVGALGRIIGIGINLTLIIAGITVLIYLLWGAFDWITSGGEKENIERARNKITSALVGIILYIGVLSVWAVITGSILGIAVFEDGGIRFNIPTFQKQPVNPGGDDPREDFPRLPGPRDPKPR